MNINNFIGREFTRLIVFEFSGVQNRNYYFICKCQCGNKVRVFIGNLLSGKTKSCGCLRKETLKKDKTVHGMKGTRFYEIWHSMKRRCLTPNYVLNVEVCDRWLEFINFKEDMYPSYLKHVEEFGEKETTLDRFPNQTGNYEPSNVRWATYSQQNRNKRDSTISDDYPLHIYWKYKLQILLNSVLRKNQETNLVLETYLGCSIKDFRKHIESQFLPGMTRDNHGQGIGFWQLEHIVGCNNFDLSKEEDRKKCFNFINFQPLWWEDHKRKSNRRLDVKTHLKI